MVNITMGDVIGLQGAGIANFTGGTVHGLQASGVFNYAGGLQGVQGGVVNIIRKETIPLIQEISTALCWAAPSAPISTSLVL